MVFLYSIEKWTPFILYQYYDQWDANMESGNFWYNVHRHGHSFLLVAEERRNVFAIEIY